MASLKQGLSTHAADNFGELQQEDSDSEDGSDVSSQRSFVSAGDSEDYPALVWDQTSKPKGINTSEATVSLITACVGAGIMALPQLPKSTGILPTLVMTPLCALMVLESISCFFKGYTAWNDSHGEKEQLQTFEDFGKAAYGRPGAILVRVIQIGWFMGAASGYVILISEQLVALEQGVLDFSKHQWVLILAPVLLLLAMLRDVSALAQLMPVGAFAAVATCGLIALQSSRDAEVWDAWPQDDQDKVHSLWPEHGLMPLGSALATLFGAFGMMGNVPPVLDEMKKKRRLPNAVRNSMGFVMVLYIMVIVLGYWAYGNYIQPNIVLSMSRSPGNFTQAMTLPVQQWTGHQNRMIPSLLSCCVLTNLVMSYPLIMMCVFVSLQGTTYGRKKLVAGSAANYGMRVGLVGITLAIASSVSRFDVLFALFASVCGPIQSTIIPIMFSAKIRASCGVKGSRCFRCFVHGIILTISVFCLVGGFIDSLNNLIASSKEA